MILEYELTAEDVRQTVLNTLQEHLSLETKGYSCTTEMTLNVLLKAAVDRSSLEAACADLEQVASSNRLREQLMSLFMAKRQNCAPMSVAVRRNKAPRASFGLRLPT